MDLHRKGRGLSAECTEEAMGLLTEGKPLSWPETKKHAAHVQRTGVKQFIAIYHRLRERKGDQLKWGDEVLIKTLGQRDGCL